MDAVSRRLIKELRDYQQDPNTQIVEELSPVADDDLLSWRAVLVGPEGSAYEGGRFDLDIQMPTSYPMQPPVIKFVGKVCHPNVHFKTGEICLDLLKTAWSPAWTLQSACLAISALLTSNLDDKADQLGKALKEFDDKMSKLIEEAFFKGKRKEAEIEWRRIPGGQRSQPCLPPLPGGTQELPPLLLSSLIAKHEADG
ncbi:hypothetical protein PhCBS80983_g00040 [Powellomyces hirtus]|uniref:UBC core domain-containing protein n=1 Tax=Powellomyces hirtus TaxID=109895 RepID=A0A507EFU8_9FUNG|nr:hypothetical protein PhCBS80983_g00040 [Powellomyces hirtus]